MNPRVSAPRQTADAVRVVAYEPALRPQVLRLLTHLWGPDEESNSLYFAWKHERNPYIEQPRFYIAMHEDRAIGMRGLYGSRWQHDGAEFDLACLVDSVVEPHWRGRGVLAHLTREILEREANLGAGHILTLSPSAATHHLAMKLGGHEIGLLELCSRKTSAHVRGLAHSSSLPAVTISSQPRPAALAGYTARRPSEERIRHVQDATYWNWRLENPRHRYRFFYLEGDPLAGYAIEQFYEKNGERRARILDWQADNVEGLIALLGAVCRQTDVERLMIWRATFDEPRTALLDAAGFALHDPKHLDFSRLLLYAADSRTNSMPLAPWLDLANWDLRLLHSDAY